MTAGATSETEVPVLIVGASLVGMTSALLLARHGIPALAVEHHRGTAIHPRAAHATQRTLEILREAGLEERVRARSAEQFPQEGGIVGVHTLAGGLTASYIPDLNAGVRDVSPCERLFLSQTALEPLLRERAEALGARLRFATEVVSLRQDATGVTALLRERDGGAMHEVRASWVIAADGARSRVRQQLGLGTHGRGTFSRSATLYFRADLRPLVAAHNWAVVYVNNERLRGFFRFEKPFLSGFLAVNTTGDPAMPDTDVARDGLDPEQARELVFAALGTRDVAVQIDDVMPWEASALVADRLRAGRIFLAGDAAHAMPPTGGFGGNTGIADAHNLAWKLALVLKGHADPVLLDTYETERLPVADFTVEQAYTRYVLRTDPSLDRGAAAPLVPDLEIELGYRYASSAIAAGPDPAPLHGDPRASRGQPGTRLPHVWLSRGGERVSTLDLPAGAFALLAAPDGTAWADAAGEAARTTAVPISAHRPGTDALGDPTGACVEALGLRPNGCLLVRPDGFVAWRSGDQDEPTGERLAEIVLQLLGRTPDA
jgi:2-polyprenyl-6-methoxyphenol hydroxylase-like FAD-dependent oxidoreductase